MKNVNEMNGRLYAIPNTLQSNRIESFGKLTIISSVMPELKIRETSDRN